ncbi:hypothetical protein DD918_14325 [Staphylococcus pseudintermedius]|nr:hypothetical protein [Staphylococcus pseudintermedius]PXA35102.1 hypothetical protein DD918_14325 [Staphylococcus pseudintermedius]
MMILMIAKIPKPRPSNAMIRKATSKFTTIAITIKNESNFKKLFLIIMIHIPFIIFVCIDDLK